ncbi:hypothetical protein OSJ57_26010, partial [Sphingomonas sp. HH69]
AQRHIAPARPAPPVAAAPCPAESPSFRGRPRDQMHRRIRNGWGWASGGDVPLGEESERYVVTVLDGGAVVRAAESTVPQWQYDAAMIAADGVAGRALVLEVRQVGTRATGRAARIDFTA